MEKTKFEELKKLINKKNKDVIAAVCMLFVDLAENKDNIFNDEAFNEIEKLSDSIITFV